MDFIRLVSIFKIDWCGKVLNMKYNIPINGIIKLCIGNELNEAVESSKGGETNELDSRTL